MNFKINFSYRIGKMGFDDNSRRTGSSRGRRSVNNDDLKEGDNGAGMDVGDQQGGGVGQPQLNGRGGARQGAGAQSQTKTPEVKKKKSKKEKTKRPTGN